MKCVTSCYRLLKSFFIKVSNELLFGSINEDMKVVARLNDCRINFVSDEDDVVDFMIHYDTFYHSAYIGLGLKYNYKGLQPDPKHTGILLSLSKIKKSCFFVTP